MSKKFYLSDLRNRQNLIGLMFFMEDDLLNIIIDGKYETSLYARETKILEVRDKKFSTSSVEGDLFLPVILSRGEDGKTL